MSEYIYVCKQCLFYSNEDFWGCKHCCEDESKVVQVTVSKLNSSMIFAFVDKEISYDKANTVVKTYLQSNKISSNDLHSRHNFQLHHTFYEIVVKL